MAKDRKWIAAQRAYIKQLENSVEHSELCIVHCDHMISNFRRQKAYMQQQAEVEKKMIEEQKKRLSDYVNDCTTDAN